jgi:hypothetical protein
VRIGYGPESTRFDVQIYAVGQPQCFMELEKGLICSRLLVVQTDSSIRFAGSGVRLQRGVGSGQRAVGATLGFARSETVPLSLRPRPESAVVNARHLAGARRIEKGRRTFR